MGREPASLFLYGDNSVAARSVRQAIYDGPFDIVNYAYQPVLLEKMPASDDGSIRFEAVSVQPGTAIAGVDGRLVNLAEGVPYYPSGCRDASCVQVYGGSEPVQMDQMVVDFRLRPEQFWSDGAPLTSDDSLYSYEVARGLYPRARAESIAYTQSYQALDAQTVQWRGAPGFRTSSFAGNFFIPLPRHAWGALSPEELLASELSTRKPLGWGAYVIDEWTPGDHISLSRNPRYWRAGESLPAFDRLVFRFMPDQDAAIAALQAGECDYLDESNLLETRHEQLAGLQQEGKIATLAAAGAAWEHLDFGIASANAALPPLFQVKEVRQAVALCLDRQAMASALAPLAPQAPDSYVAPGHPLANPQVRRYSFDPQAGAALLESAGWLDADADPATARTALGVPGIADGTPLEFALLTTNEDEKQRAAQMIVDSLAKCGMKVTVSAYTWDVLLGAGPQGPVFGRNFHLAQFGWLSALEPACTFYTTFEVPGTYPEYPKGWGGANASGYSNPSYDLACQQALSSLPGTPEYQSAHYQAQATFAEDLPALPLYLRTRLVAMRSDLCNVILDPSAESALWNLENFLVGDVCPPG
jgi:peptide/nickel transport system substrate-binding protein